MSELVSIKCKAVLFEMDGTLVDSAQAVELAWGGWAVRHKMSLEDVLSLSHGRPTIAGLEHFLPGRDHSEELEELSRFEATKTEGILAVPGAVEVLDTLQKQNHCREGSEARFVTGNTLGSTVFQRVTLHLACSR
jgi:mannitol-1-/sugar-/sorbitol-6-phosphatase